MDRMWCIQRILEKSVLYFTVKSKGIQWNSLLVDDIRGCTVASDHAGGRNLLRHNLFSIFRVNPRQKQYPLPDSNETLPSPQSCRQ